MQREPKKFARRYPWRMWFKKEVFRLVRGIHYTHQTHVMAQMIRNAASYGRGGLKPCRVSIKISSDDKSLTVKVLPKENTNAIT